MWFVVFTLCWAGVQDPLLEYVVHPARIKGFNDSSVLSIMTPPPPSPLVDVAAASASGGSPISPSFLNDPDAEVVFLGTSAAIPSKYRNGLPLMSPSMLMFRFMNRVFSSERHLRSTVTNTVLFDGLW